MKVTARHSRPPVQTLFRERLREERARLQLPPPAPPERKREPERKPEGGTSIIIQVWPTTPEPADGATDATG